MSANHGGSVDDRIRTGDNDGRRVDNSFRIGKGLSEDAEDFFAGAGGGQIALIRLKIDGG